MTLRRRIIRLEARPRGDPVAERATAGERLMEMLIRLENHVVATGDASDDPTASPMERTVRRWLRGDATIKDALHDLASGRWP